MADIVKIRTDCPECGCPMWQTTGTSTADNHRAWRDEDGTWYNGPANQDTTRSCAHCNWSQRIVRKRGKIESVDSDPLTP